jgi:hypothetical protein
MPSGARNFLFLAPMLVTIGSDRHLSLNRNDQPLLALPCQRTAPLGHSVVASLQVDSFPTGGGSGGDKRFLTERCLSLSPSDSRTPMTLTVIRCPYCVLEVQFRPMVPHLDGRFICDKCGHLSLPRDRSFSCSCRKCVELQASRIYSDVSPVLKIKTVAS